MFEKLHKIEDDFHLAMIGLFNADPRSEKVDLGVGVYRDENGRTPVMRAVKAAEERILATEDTKAYIGPRGDTAFLGRLWAMVAGKPSGRFAGVQTPGGSGALRLASDLVALSPSKRIWLGVPTWPNHPAVFKAADSKVATYPFFAIARQQVLFDQMMAALQKADAGDAVLLHATSHNPTGAQLRGDQWDALARFVAQRGLIPLLDSAYQGFGIGLEEDAAGLRAILAEVPGSAVGGLLLQVLRHLS